MELKGKVAFVTGGASGLGEATVRNLVHNGAQVVIADLQEEKGQALVDELGSNLVQFVKTDVTDEESVQEALNVAKKLGEINVVVNCAGIGAAKKTVGSKGVHDLSTFQKVVQVNLVGTFNVIRLAADLMKDNNASAIIHGSGNRQEAFHSAFVHLKLLLNRGKYLVNYIVVLVYFSSW